MGGHPGCDIHSLMTHRAGSFISWIVDNPETIQATARNLACRFHKTELSATLNVL